MKSHKLIIIGLVGFFLVGLTNSAYARRIRIDSLAEELQISLNEESLSASSQLLDELEAAGITISSNLYELLLNISNTTEEDKDFTTKLSAVKPLIILAYGYGVEQGQNTVDSVNKVTALLNDTGDFQRVINTATALLENKIGCCAFLQKVVPILPRYNETYLSYIVDEEVINAVKQKVVLYFTFTLEHEVEIKPSVSRGDNLASICLGALLAHDINNPHSFGSNLKIISEMSMGFRNNGRDDSNIILRLEEIGRYTQGNPSLFQNLLAIEVAEGGIVIEYKPVTRHVRVCPDIAIGTDPHEPQDYTISIDYLDSFVFHGVIPLVRRSDEYGPVFISKMADLIQVEPMAYGGRFSKIFRDLIVSAKIYAGSLEEILERLANAILTMGEDSEVKELRELRKILLGFYPF